MKKLYVIILFLLPLSSLAQESISYSTGRENIRFAISHDEYYLEFSGEAWQQSLQNIGTKRIVTLGANAARITLSLPGANFETRKTFLANLLRGQFKRIEPVLVYEDSTRQICTGQIIIKAADTTRIEGLFSHYDITIQPDEFVSRQYLVNFNTLTTQQVFALLTQLKNNSGIEFAEPNFIRFIKSYTSDPYYSSQWAIKNQGYLGGTSGADMHVEAAWNYATGQGIKVAVIDEGVDLNHPDLAANLLTGYDATGNNSAGAPNSTNNDAHGTACAGIIAAVANNNKGTAGVAYNAKVIPVRVAYSNGLPLNDPNRTWVTSDSWLASGITWARKNGADILSNSWGGGSPSTDITNAINDAVNKGRGGKGCVVLFASGNNNSSTISYPSSLSNVIAVGASSMCDERKSFTSCDGETWWGGNYGTGLDVMAPGVKIYTTDISGTAGYDTGDYKSDFNGTSSATPNTAAVVALILSVNPNLTAQQARDILETTCEKVGGYTYQSNVSGQPNGTWSSDAGYGRVNACAAISKTLTQILSISGDASFCTTSNSYHIPNLPAGSSVTWSATPLSIVTINSPNANQTTLTKTGNGTITLTATISIACTSNPILISLSNIMVGLPNDIGLDVSAGMYDNLSDCGDGANFQVLYNAADNNQYSGTVFVTAANATSLSWTVAPWSSAQSWSWNESNNGHTVYVATKSANKEITLKATASNACGSIVKYYSFSTGACPLVLLSAPAPETYSISPNPAGYTFTVSGNADAENITTASFSRIGVYDAMGNLKKQTLFAAGTHKAQMSIAELPTGYYYVEISDGKTVQRKVLMVKR